MVSWKKILLFAHLGLLVATIAVGRWLYDGAFGQSDILAVINPRPKATMADNLVYCPVNPYSQIHARSGHTASNIFMYVRDWYTGMNGRLSVAVMNSLIAWSAKKWCPTPESFPWWLMRTLSLYCLLAAPLNFMAAGWILTRRAWITLALLAAVWSAWFVSPKIYIFSVIYDCLLTDRYVHVYVLSWMVSGLIGGWMTGARWKWGLLAVGILFLGAEQNMLSVPILLMAAAWLGLEGKEGKWRAWLRQAGWFCAWTCAAALIFFLSPGQQLRNTCYPMKSIGNVAPVEWYRRVIELGYQAIFPPAGSPWIWHLVLYGGLGLVMAAWTIKRLKNRAAGRQQANDPGQKLFGIGLMAFAFLTAFLASMATLIVSSYFPPYAICYPSLLLALGLAFSFWFAVDSAGLGMEKIGAHWRKPVMGYARTGLVAGLPLILTITLVGTVTVKTWPSLAAQYHQIMEKNLARRQIYAGIVEEKNKTGQRHFVLVNLWNSPIWGLHMDEAWARAGYFRWRGMEDVVCLTEEEWLAAGQPREPSYLKIDCAAISTSEGRKKR